MQNANHDIYDSTFMEYRALRHHICRISRNKLFAEGTGGLHCWDNQCFHLAATNASSTTISL